MARLDQAQPASATPVDPQQAREHLVRILKVLTDDTDAGAAARDALHRLARAARDLLQLVAGHEV